VTDLSLLHQRDPSNCLSMSTRACSHGPMGPVYFVTWDPKKPPAKVYEIILRLQFFGFYLSDGCMKTHAEGLLLGFMELFLEI
jgi:hypothetical protein